MTVVDQGDSDVIRRIVADMSDEAVRNIVGGIISGLAEGVVEVLTEQVLQLLGDRGQESAPAPEPYFPPPEAAAPRPTGEATELALGRSSSAPPHPLDQIPARKRTEGDKHSCEVCGRVGSRRYIQTPTGWKCSPTATACAPQFRPPGTYTPPVASDIRANIIPANVAPPPSMAPHVLKHELPFGITARCRDCTRSWNLTGKVLEAATEQHELAHGHIVEVSA